MPKAKHAAHIEQLTRLRRIEGQIRGLQKMIEEKKYCIDILQQSKAVRAALNRVEMEIMRRHVEHCVAKISKTGSTAEVEKRINEIVSLIGTLKI